MVYYRRYRRKRPMRRKRAYRRSYRRPTRRRFAWGSRRRYGLTKVGMRGLGLPQRLSMNVKYAYSRTDIDFDPTINPFSDLSSSGFRFYGNCCAPAYVGGSATLSADTARPFPDIWSLYGRVYIPYSTFRVTLSNQSSTAVRAILFASPDVAALEPTTIEAVKGLPERTRARTFNLAPRDAGGSMRTLSMKMSTKAVQSEEFVTSESLMFTQSAPPADPWYWNCAIYSLDGVSVPDVTVQVELVYKCILVNKQQPFDSPSGAAMAAPTSIVPRGLDAPTEEEDPALDVAKLKDLLMQFYTSLSALPASAPTGAMREAPESSAPSEAREAPTGASAAS